MHLAWRLIGQRLMRARGIIKGEVGGDACLRLLERGVFLEIDLFILHAAPEPFGEDVIVIAALAVHADACAGRGKHGSKSLGRELAALVAVEDVRRTAQKRRFQGFDAKATFHVGGQSPAYDISAVPIQHCHQITIVPTQPDVGDVGRPHLIGPDNRNTAQQIRINRMRRMRLAGIRLRVNRLQTARSSPPMPALSIP